MLCLCSLNSRQHLKLNNKPLKSQVKVFTIANPQLSYEIYNVLSLRGIRANIIYKRGDRWR